MSTLTTVTPVTPESAMSAVSPLAAQAVASDRPAVTLRRVLRAEWIKLRSVRSLVLGLAGAVAAAVLLGMLISSVAGSGARPGPPGASAATDSVTMSLAGFHMTQLIVGVLGVLVVATEYSTGLIRTTFAAVTRRLPVLWAKVAVFGTVTLVVMAVTAVVALFAGQAVFTGAGGTASLTDPGVLRVVAGTAAYTAGVGLMGIALGFLLRSTAAAIGVLFAFLLIVPVLASLLPSSFQTVTQFLPSKAGSSFTSLTAAGDVLSPGAGAAVFLAWVVGLLAAAAWAVRRRDA
jgi:ABC-type transport system involved in multi-copper enzyme maturation permease subunit